MKFLQPALCLGLAVLLAGCSSPRQTVVQKPGVGPISGPGVYNRTSRDGSPWWDVDVSKIPDAVPMPHQGSYKANPYEVMGKTYFPLQDARRYRASGVASWYGTKFHGQATANGETYDLYGMTAAHKTLPLPSYVRVTNLENGKSVILRVNDRGPFYSDRIIDLSFAAAKKLGYAEVGTARVTVEGIDPYEWWAQQGRPVPLVMNPGQVLAPSNSKPISLPQASAVAKAQPIEEYVPPVQQHAAALAPEQIDSKKNASVGLSGLFLQVGAFANPDAAQLLKDKLGSLTAAPVFISSVELRQQVLHRVRLGPIGTPAEAQQLQESIRLANLGQPTLVRP